MCTVTDAAALLRRCLQQQALVAYRLCFDTPPLGTLTVHESGANFEWDPAGLAGGKAGTPQEPPRRGARQPQAKTGRPKSQGTQQSPLKDGPASRKEYESAHGRAEAKFKEDLAYSRQDQSRPE